MLVKTLYIFAMVILCNAFFNQLPMTTNRCWYIYGDDSKLSNLIFKNKLGSERSNILVFSTENSTYLQDSSSNCDGFIIIQSTVNDSKIETDLIILNETMMVNTKIILITENIDQDYNDIQNLIKRTYLNVVIIKIPKYVEQNTFFEIEQYDFNRYEIQAPSIGLTIFYDQKKMQPNIKANFCVIDELFKKQIWNPADKYMPIRIVANMYPPFSTVNEKGELGGFEYRIAKGVSSKWKTSVRSFAEANINVRHFLST